MLVNDFIIFYVNRLIKIKYKTKEYTILRVKNTYSDEEILSSNLEGD